MNKSRVGMRLDSSLHPYVAKGLRDVDDEQVLSDALRCGATVLLTENLRDFKIPDGEMPGVRVCNSASFMGDCVAEFGSKDLAAILERWRLARQRPPQSRQDVLDLLRRIGWVKFGEAVEGSWRAAE